MPDWAWFTAEDRRLKVKYEKREHFEDGKQETHEGTGPSGGQSLWLAMAQMCQMHFPNMR